MKIYYYKEQNFGDQLNPWLWNQILPGLIDNDEKIAFLGIGTLLNNVYLTKMKKARHKIIFSTGFGYGKQDNIDLDSTYKIYCVRGPLTAQKLGLPGKLAITDGALLVRGVFDYKSYKKKYKYAYMPHYQLAGDGWALACEKIGFGYIDPSWPVDKVLSSISETEILLAEAMHGAIIADTFRVPWIPIITNTSILKFKWLDWCASLGVDYQPAYMERLHHPREKLDLYTPVRRVRDVFRQSQAGKKLTEITKTYKPALSIQTKADECYDKLYGQLESLQKDMANGVFK
ncbi:MAG: polysaccharide pyruvyl transferase family protein [Crocosphaera sp.]|nr:polysaccharide pyruvyl transferase family protein [Crocosphaera sp.]